MKIISISKILGLLLIPFLFCSTQFYTQDWREQNDYKLTYNLTGQKILIIADDESSYEETVEMVDAWRSYGADITIAAPAKQFNTTKMSFSPSSPNGVIHTGKFEIKSDLLISDVDINNFSAVYLPGGDSYETLTTKYKDEIAGILNRANRQKKVIGAFCHGPAILSVTDFIKGKNVVVEGSNAYKLLANAGAIIQEIPVICDKNVITCRFPYLQSMIYTFAEKLQYPKGGGPLEKINKNKIPFMTELENLANTNFYKAVSVNRDTIGMVVKIGLKSIISEKYSYNSKIRFVCVDDKKIIEKIKALAFENSKPAYKDLPEERLRFLIERTLNAPVLLFTFNDLSSLRQINDETAREYEESKLTFYNGAACQNLMLAASHLGIGTNLVGTSFFNTASKELKELLNLPQEVTFVNLLTIGYPQSKLVPTVTRPVSQFLFFNEYKSKAD